MSNWLKMAEQQTILALARLGWSYRRIAAEVGVDRETVARHVKMAAASGAMCAASDFPAGEASDANAAISITGSETAAGRQAIDAGRGEVAASIPCLLYTSPSPRDRQKSRMPSSA